MDELLTAKQVGERLKVSPNTLAGWRHAGNGPSYTRLGRLIRYRPADVDVFVAAGVRNTAAARTRKRNA